jgi:cell division protein FtsL
VTATSVQRTARKAPAKKRLSVVAAQKNKERRRLPWLLIISIVCVFTVIFGVLLARVVLVKTSFKLQKLQGELTQAEELHEELLLEAAKMESPARIERMARSIGMVDPLAVNYIVADVPQRAQKRFAYGTLPDTVPSDSTVAAIAEDSP